MAIAGYLGCIREGLAYAISPGIFHEGTGDPLAGKVRSDLTETKRDERFSRYERFTRLGLARVRVRVRVRERRVQPLADAAALLAERYADAVLEAPRYPLLGLAWQSFA